MVLTDRRGHTFSFPGFADISGMLRVPLGTMYENCFCLPCEAKRDAHRLPMLVLKPIDLREASGLSHGHARDTRTRACQSSQVRETNGRGTENF